jgi:ACS family tartrate transporter-like MFS transporter
MKPGLPGLVLRATAIFIWINGSNQFPRLIPAIRIKPIMIVRRLSDLSFLTVRTPLIVIQATGEMDSVTTLSDVGEQARRRIAWRLLPFLFVLYFIAYLDRVNVGFAGLEMSHNLGFTDRVFGLGAGIFFAGYFLFEIPGALLVERWSARRWIARILITWGMVTVMVSMIHTRTQFYGARFLLGLAEAGFFPGIVVYLTHWFRNEDRARAGALFMAAIPVANVMGSPLAGWLLGVNWFGIPGWRWLFIVEGIPAVVLGIVTLFYLTDWPHQARWMPADEQEWIMAELQREKQAKAASGAWTVSRALGNRQVILLASIYFFALVGLYGFNFWFPTILKRATGLPNLTVTFIAALPYLLGVVAMLWNGWHSDRTGERRWHTGLILFACGVFMALAVGLQDHLWAGLGFLILSGACTTAFMPSFWQLPTAMLSESAAAASIGLINSVGGLGGFVGPFFVGYLRTLTGSFSVSLIFLIAALFLSTALVLTLRIQKT